MTILILYYLVPASAFEKYPIIPFCRQVQPQEKFFQKQIGLNLVLSAENDRKNNLNNK